jgi:Co/Zn/Cd efflux system component
VCAVAFVLIEAWRRLHDPPVVAGGGMLVVAAAGLAVNVFVARCCTRIGTRAEICVARICTSSDFRSVGAIVAA